MSEKLSEHQIQSQIIQYLHSKGWHIERMNSGAMRQRDLRGKMYIIRLHEAGTPDLMAFKTLYDNDGGRIGARLLFIEVKVPGNKPTRLQELKMQQLHEKGATCIIAHSVEEVEKVIQ
ncbi:MAG TPA: VRR-NUC domain-containing protein [Clostridia bacterium]